MRWLRSGKEPSEEVDCGDGHADAEKYASKNSFRAALTKREGQACDHNRNE